MDIAELLDTTREQRIASSLANLSSLFSASIQEFKIVQNQKAKVAKQKRKYVRKKKTEINPECSEKNSGSKFHQDTPIHSGKSSRGDNETRFTASSNPRNKPGGLRNKHKLCSESTAEKFSSTSNHAAIQDILLPTPASSSFNSKREEPRSLSNPMKEVPADPCSFEEDILIGTAGGGGSQSLSKISTTIKSLEDKITLTNRKGKFISFPIFREDKFRHKSLPEMMEKLVGEVTYDEDQSSDDGIVEDGLTKAKNFLIKNIKTIVRSSIKSNVSTTK